MSVVGIDFGTANSVVAVVRSRGVDIIANEVSRRQTASMVGIAEKNRELGEAAKSNWKRNFRSTLFQPKRLIGLKYSDLKEEKPYIGACRFSENKNRVSTNLFVPFLGENISFSPEQIAAQLFTKLKHLTESACQSPIADVVISVPGYFTNEQRKSVLNAGKIAGLNVLRVVSDTSALSSYYLYLHQRNLAPDDSRDIMLMSVGAANTQVSIVSIKKTGFKILASEYHPNLGGRNIDLLLANFFVDKFNKQYNVDLRETPKSWYRVLTACEKVKKNINLGKQASINEMCIFEDFDMNYNITKEEFSELIAPLKEELVATIQKALDKTGKDIKDMHSFEWVGGAMRLIEFQQTVSDYFGRPIENHMNAEEACAMGCALQCAFISPRVQLPANPTVGDIQDVPIILSYKIGDQEEKKLELVKCGAPLNSPKSIKKLMLTHDVDVVTQVSLSYKYPPYEGAEVDIAKYEISGIKPLQEGSTQEKVRLLFKHDSNGICSLINADVVENITIEYEEKVPIKKEKKETAPEEKKEETAPEEKKEENAEEKKEENAEEKKEENMEVDGTENSNEPEYEIVMKTKKETKYHPLQVDTIFKTGLTEEQVNEYISVEQRLIKADEDSIKLADSRNNLESYVYSTRSKLTGEWLSWSNEEERQNIAKVMDEIESWLYGEGEEATLEQLLEKTKYAYSATSVVTDRIEEQRRKEEEERRKKEEEERKKREEEEKKRKEEEERKKKEEEEKKKEEEGMEGEKKEEEKMEVDNEPEDDLD